MIKEEILKIEELLKESQNIVFLTGAGISTAANIPDYRGPNGVWTCLDEGRDIAACDLARAEPTFTHMTLFTLFKKGKLKHIVSQVETHFDLTTDFSPGALITVGLKQSKTVKKMTRK